MGIGNDIVSEKKLRKEIPNCTFYGADPILQSGRIFKQLGSYYELAVAATSGTIEASVLENGSYKIKNVTAVTLVDFLKTYANISTIDYMFMDNEGAEYDLLRQFMYGGLLDKERVTICQLSVELHGPFRQHGINASEYEHLISSLIKSSAFVPLWSAAPGIHARSFYFNAESRYCLEKYLLSSFCLD